MKLLIVEDNPDHQLILKRKLEDYYNKKIEIETASDVHQAQESLKKSSYNSILLDYRLSGSNGIDLVEWLNQNGIDTPVIMITSADDIELVVRAVKMGVYDYLFKNKESFDKLPLLLDKVMKEYDLKKKLEETKFKYHALVERINEVVFLLDKKGGIIYVNGSIKKLLGYTEDEFKEKFLTILSEEEKESFFSHLKAVVQGEFIEPFILGLKRKDGQTIYVEINESQFVEEGNVKGVIGTLQDVTKRVLLEKEIQSERHKVIDIFNSIVDLIYVIDNEYRIHFINRAAERHSGNPLGRKCYNVLFNKKKPCSFCKWKSIIEGYTVRWELRREDGRTFDIVTSPIKNPDGSLHLMEILRDITRRKEMEEKYRLKSEETAKANEQLKRTIDQLKQTQEQLIQSEKLVAIGKLVSGFAHELNNPLFSAMGYVELLLMDYEVNDEQREKLKNVLSAVKRARTIVTDLLRFARRENVEKEIININNVLNQTIALRRYALKVNNIDVEFDLQADIPHVEGNFTRLQQVFLNLLINAEQAIKSENGSGLIKIHSLYNKKKNSVLVEVSDNGTEIPQENIRKIFDPFFTTKEVGKGTGLGLSTSYGIIKDHNGNIRVKSSKNLTTFIVSLPAVKGGVRMQRHDSSDEGDIMKSKESILVVDDEPVIVSLLEDFLMRKGFQILTAVSAKEAFSKLEKKDIEVIVTDFHMPEMDGKRFYEELKAKRPEMLNRIIFITGDTMDNEVRSFIEGVNAPYVKKPFSLSEIADLIYAVVKNSRQKNLF